MKEDKKLAHAYYYSGKRLEDCTREELIDAAKTAYDMYLSERNIHGMTREILTTVRAPLGVNMQMAQAMDAFYRGAHTGKGKELKP